VTPPTPDRRGDILSAALACFVARGIDASTIADIRDRAGATTGSVYHYFEGKDAIVGALYVEVLRGYQRDLAESLDGRASPRAFVRGVVEHYLSWVEAHPDAARFLFDARRAGAIAAVEGEIGAANVESVRALRSRMQRWIATGEIRKMPTELYVAILAGPAEAFARQWLAKRTKTEMRRARGLLAAAAWCALRGEAGEE
jgi:AcrR family transcriptional regulator